MRSLIRKLMDPGGKSSVAEGEPAIGRHRDKPGVLIVVDDLLVRLMVQRGLERNGFHARVASTGADAVGLCRTHRDSIVVVLLDVAMPGLDGPTILDALYHLNPEVRICVMNGDANDYSPAGRTCGD